VATALEAAHAGLTVEIVIIQTTGDKVLDSPLSRIGGKGVFTKEIEEALLDGRIDFAVHCLKDLPTAQPAGLALGAITEREDPRDILIAPAPFDLPTEATRGAVIGTSSLRRSAQLRQRTPGVEIRELRGNVPTRIRRAMEGEYAAIVLAAAGVRRLGLELPWSRVMTPEEMLPAPGQGALGLQICEGDERVSRILAPLHHAATAAACTAERTLLQALGGGCQLPLGALATVESDGSLYLRGRVVSLDGRRCAEHALTGHVSDPVALGRSLAEVMKGLGAAEILAELDLTPPEAGFEQAVAAAAAMDRGPLGGRTVVVTRDEDADGPVSLAIRQRGGQPLVIPLVRHSTPDYSTPMEDAARALTAGGFDWLVLTSSRGVEALATVLTRLGLQPGGCATACVGEATASAARDAGFNVALVPGDALAEALAASLIARGISGRRLLYPRADKAAPALAERLRAAGATVVDPVAYCTTGESDSADVRRLLGTRRVDAIVFCSPSAVESLAGLEPETRARLLQGAVVASIGPRTSAALRAAGVEPHCEPVGDRSFDAVVEAATRRLANLPLS